LRYGSKAVSVLLFLRHESKLRTRELDPLLRPENKDMLVEVLTYRSVAAQFRGDGQQVVPARPWRGRIKNGEWRGADGNRAGATRSFSDLTSAESQSLNSGVHSRTARPQDVGSVLMTN
jgi:hypothetical protein